MPENQNMQKTSDNEAMLQEIVRSRQDLCAKLFAGSG